MYDIKKIKDKYDCGVITYDSYLDFTNNKASTKYKFIKSIIVFIFPYPNKFYDSKNFQTAKFSYGKDYHLVVNEKIEEAVKELGLKGEYKIMSDISFLHEKTCAYLAGLGVIGKNTLLLTKKYGSRVVIGEVITDQEFIEYDKPATYSFCDNCEKCIKVCPTNALNNGLIRERCLSHLNQSKSTEYELFEKMKHIAFGCDICQDVCPANKVEFKPLEVFEYDGLSTLKFEEFENLDDVSYLEKYANKNFNWIGYLKMLRNLLVLKANKKTLSYYEIEKYQNKFYEHKWFYNHLEYIKNKMKEDNEYGNN